MVVVEEEGLQLRLLPPIDNKLLWLTDRDRQTHTGIPNTRPEEPPTGSSHDMMREGVEGGGMGGREGV